MFLYNNEKININDPFEHEGINYPNLQDAELRAQIGIVEVDDPINLDARFYYILESSNGTLITIPKSLEQVKTFITQKIANDRYTKETGGVSLPDGTVIATDRESQAKVSGALLFLQRNPTQTINWKSVSGWKELSLVEIEAIADAVATHVQGCFNEEKNALDKLETYTDVQKIIEDFA